MTLRLATALLLVLTVSCEAEIPSPSVELSLMSFNIRYDNPNDGQDAWPLRADWVGQVIRDSGADLVGLQEALRHQVDAVAAQLGDFSWIGVGRDDGRNAGEFAPLFYRKDRLELVDWGTIWLSETPADTASVGWDAALTRIATRARFLMPDGDTLTAINAHFDHRGAVARERSATLLASLLEGVSPAILMGDLNLGQSAPGYGVLVGSGLTDTYEAAGRPEPEDTFTGFDATGVPGNRIDYVFQRGGEVRAHQALTEVRDGRYVSDHRPIIASVHF